MRKFLILALALILSTVNCAFANDKEENKFPKNQEVSYIEDEEGVYVIKIKASKLKDELKPYVVEELMTTRELYDQNEFTLVVNGGFFDGKNKKTVSFVVINGETVADPNNNENLIENKYLEPYLDKILNRSELRAYDFQGHTVYDITTHSEPVPVNCQMKHSLQAGPQLVPELRLEEELFILKDEEGKVISERASSLHKYARTAVGIKDNDVYIFIATDKAPKTLEEMAELAKKFKMEKALALDGGGSTSIDFGDLHIITEKNDTDQTGRKVKSFLIIP